MKPRLVLGALMPTDVIDRARTEFDAVIAQGPGDMTGPEIISAAVAHRADAIMFVNTLPLDAATIAALPASVRVGATSSVGYDHIDVAAARARGIVVTNTPDVLTECTADHTMLLLLAAARRAIEYDRIMRQGWRFRIGQGDLLGVRVTGKTLGILGMGRIGQAVARRARGFDMRIVYHARQRLPPAQEKGATYFASLDAMLPHCQFLSLHAPASPATDRIMNRRTLGLLPEGAVLVNVARGSLVDEDALIEALTGAAAETRGGGFAETSVAKPAEARTGGLIEGLTGKTAEASAGTPGDKLAGVTGHALAGGSGYALAGTPGDAATGTLGDPPTGGSARTPSRGRLFAAGLDVFRAEPAFDTRLAALDNVVLSPHVGSATRETRNAMGFRALDNIAAVLAGRPPIDPLPT